MVRVSPLSFALGLGFWLLSTPIASAQSLVAAVLPASRSVQVNSAATAFATIINSGSATATSCSIAPPPGLAATFSYQTTDPTTNQVTGTPNTPVNIAAGSSQTFVIAITPTAPIAPTDVALVFDCTNTTPAASVVGLNTLLLSASSTASPDIVALSATLNSDGISSTRGTTGAGVLSVATVNVGASGTVTVSVDTGSVVLPIGIGVCQTNPSTGACISATGTSVTTTIDASATPTFGIFLVAAGQILFDPAVNRLFIKFRDSSGTVRGATSVAVRVVQDVVGTFNGLATVTQTGCRDPSDNLTIAANVTLIFSGQVGESFSGSQSILVSVPGGTFREDVSFAGTLDASERFRGTFTYTDFVNDAFDSSGNGTFTGSLTGTTFSLQSSGQDTVGDTCRFTTSATLVRQ